MNYVDLLNTAVRACVVKQEDKFISTMQFQCFSSPQITMEIVFLSSAPPPSSLFPLRQESRAEKPVRKVWGEEKGVGRGRENPTDEGKSLLVFSRASLCFPCCGRGASASHGHSRVGSSGSAQTSWAPEGHLLCLSLREKRLKSHPASKSQGGRVLFPESDLELCTMPNTQG